MAHVRITEEGIARRQRQMEALRSEIRRLEGIKADANKPFWNEYLGPMVKASLEANREKRDRVLEAQTENPHKDLANLKVLSGAITAYSFIVDAVEKTEVMIDARRKAVDALKKEIDDAKSDLGLAAQA